VKDLDGRATALGPGDEGGGTRHTEHTVDDLATIDGDVRPIGVDVRGEHDRRCAGDNLLADGAGWRVWFVRRYSAISSWSAMVSTSSGPKWLLNARAAAYNVSSGLV